MNVSTGLQAAFGLESTEEKKKEEEGKPSSMTAAGKLFFPFHFGHFCAWPGLQVVLPQYSQCGGNQPALGASSPELLDLGRACTQRGEKVHSANCSTQLHLSTLDLNVLAFNI